jgi:hypothetical protein
MNAYLMVKNFKAVIDLCFGPESQSAICLQSWCDHIFDNRHIYLGWEESDPTFHTKVLYAIDKSLQIHWKSCYDNEDRSSVNDKILFMQQTQADIESQRFFYQLPKHLQDKIKPLEDNSDKTDKDKKDGKKRPGHDKNDYLKRQRVNDEQHPHWHLKEGENYGELFYPYADKCPKTTNGSTNVSDSLLEASVRRHVPEHINYPSRRKNLSRNLSTSAGGRIFNRGQRRELHLNHSTE